MNVEWWEKWLNEQYPDLKQVVRAGGRAFPSDELVAELGDGRAVAVIDRSRPHFHLRAEETYRIIKGRLGVVVHGKVWVLSEKTQPGYLAAPPMRECVVHPLVVHSAITLDRGPAVVEVVSSPPWAPTDHFEV